MVTDTRARRALIERTKGQTQKAIGESLECSQPVARDYLSGASRPGPYRRGLAFTVYKIPLQWWLTPEEGGPPPIPPRPGGDSASRGTRSQGAAAPPPPRKRGAQTAAGRRGARAEVRA